jgi:hypothetical protein
VAVDKRFEPSDWLKAIGGMLFFVAALMPWWQQETGGFIDRHNGFDDLIGIVAFVIFVGIGILTVIIKTDSLPLPAWLVDPTLVLGVAIVGAGCVAFRFFVDPFSSKEQVVVSRGLGLYLAGAAAVITLIGSVIAFRHRDDIVEELDDVDEDAEDEDDFGYDADEQDDLIRRINMSLDRTPPPATEGPRPSSRRREPEPRRRSHRTGSEDRQGRPAGPPIP